METGAHLSHINNSSEIGDNFGCVDCHSGTVSADTTISSPATHLDLDGTPDVAGTNVGTYSAGNCNSSYCHSSGQETTVNRSVNWTGGALDCKGCHGADGAFTSTSGEPNYANGGETDNITANSHQKHARASTADCNDCHDLTVNSSGNLISGGEHLNGSANASGPFMASYDDNAETCSNVTCHGGGSPEWGETLACSACHGGSEGGALSDGTPNGVNTEWSTDGHGAAAHGNFDQSSQNGCDYCHEISSAHTPTAGTNPYRLRFSATDNTLCLKCHGAAADPGIIDDSDGGDLVDIDSSLDMETAHYGAKHASTEGGQFCWDCHDPHGVPSNIIMVKDDVSVASDTYGVPTTTVTVEFTAAGDHVETTNNPRRGICQACHDPGKAGTESTKYWRWDGTDDDDGQGGNPPSASSHNAEPCTGCHIHSADFKGAGESGGGDACASCHSDLFSSTQSNYTMHGNVAQINYKHFMDNDGGSDDQGWGSKYPSDLTTSTADDMDLVANETKRRCLMCHVDHDLFNAALVGQDKRAYNMRPTITEVPTSGQNTDFDRTSATGGICISCHYKERVKKLQTPNMATKTPDIPFPLRDAANETAQLANAVELVKRSTHSYQVTGALFNGIDNAENTSFQAVCLKCHNDSIGTNFGPKSDIDQGAGAQLTQGGCINTVDGSTFGGVSDPRTCAEQGSSFWNGTPAFGRHISSNDSSMAVMGTLFEQGITSNTTTADKYTLYRDEALPPWKDGQWVGYQVIVTDGKGKHSRALVVIQNQPDVLTVANPGFADILNTTSEYDIVKSPLPTEELCFSCHSKQGQNKNAPDQKDWYGQKEMKEILTRMKDIFVGDNGYLALGEAKTRTNPAEIELCTKKTSTEVPNETIFDKYVFKTAIVKTIISKDTSHANSLGRSNTVPAPDAGCNAQFGNSAPNIMTIWVTSLPTAISQYLPYKIFKPAFHPLDNFGRHRPYERVDATSAGGAAFWNIGDEGAVTVDSAGATPSTLDDDVKAWATDQWLDIYNGGTAPEEMSVYFMSGANVGQVRQITGNLSNGTTLTFSPALIGNLFSGDQYYIGKSSGDSRHVSCADCHNTHASTNNPEGEITGADAGDPQNAANTVVSSRAYTDFWASGEWNGHLLKMVFIDNTTGVKHEEVRFITGFTLDTPNERGEMTVSIPFSRAVQGPNCDGAVGADRQECEGNLGNWYEDRFEVGMGDKWFAAGFCTDGVSATKAACDLNPPHEWRYQDGGRAGSGSTGVWGVCAVEGPVSSWTKPIGSEMTQAELANLDWGKIENIFDKKPPYQEGGSGWALQADLCIRCHSYFSFKESLPVSPSGHADGSPALETDVVSDFNPKNEAHHAVYARGQNQPLVDGQTMNALPGPLFSGEFEGEGEGSGGNAGTYIATCDTVSGPAVDDILKIPSVGWAEPITDIGDFGITGIDCAAQNGGGTLTEFKTAKNTPLPGAAINDAMLVPSTPLPPYEFNPNWPIWWDPGSPTVSSANKTVSFTVNMPVTVLPGWFYVEEASAGQWTFREIVSVDSQTGVTLRSSPTSESPISAGITAGLGNTFVPPFGPWSVLRCSDCHGSTKTDPVGPHASVNRWLMKTRDADLKFEWFNGESVVTIDPGNQHTYNDQYLCFNCHRRDVYGDIEETMTANGGTDPGDPTKPTNAALSRQRHAFFMDENANTWQLDSNSTLWDQHCRLCHGGDKLGAIHGSNSSYALRFLNGSSWGGTQATYSAPGNLSTTPPQDIVSPPYTAGKGTCYAANANGGGTPGEKVSACSSHSGGSPMIEGAQYDYQGKLNPGP
jgi:predicted CxxxxCH...CXXCH cytochrome family protein